MRLFFDYFQSFRFSLKRHLDEGIDVIFISDVSKGGEKPKQAWWSFDNLAKFIAEGKLILLRFNLADIQV